MPAKRNDLCTTAREFYHSHQGSRDDGLLLNKLINVPLHNYFHEGYKRKANGNEAPLFKNAARFLTDIFRDVSIFHSIIGESSPEQAEGLRVERRSIVL